MSIIVNRHITFTDSLKFYNSSLDTLASNLNDKDFKYPEDSYEKHPTLTEKKKKKHFYLSLRDGKRDKSDGHISDEQYLHLQNVRDTFNFNTFEDFRDHYLKKDVLLLVDVFEKFISTYLKYYGLDPCYYFSAPELSWDAMLE